MPQKLQNLALAGKDLLHLGQVMDGGVAAISRNSGVSGKIVRILKTGLMNMLSVKKSATDILVLGAKRVLNRKSITPDQFANIALARDHLLVVGNTQGKFNVMTVAWRALGELWHRPVAIVAVAPARYSFEFLTGDLKEFTLNVMPESMREEVASCGMISGRLVNKFTEFGLETVPGTRVKVPTLARADLCYECKIIHTADSGKLARHTLFIGEIVAAFASAALFDMK